MNILAELGEIWGKKDNSAILCEDGEVSNPLIYFELAYKLIHAAITKVCVDRNCTYAELLEEIRKIDPEIIEKYFELFEIVDCDVYGKWCTGDLMLEEYKRYCSTVDEWKEVTMRMTGKAR